jgi:hypothetical protein
MCCNICTPIINGPNRLFFLIQFCMSNNIIKAEEVASAKHRPSFSKYCPSLYGSNTRAWLLIVTHFFNGYCILYGKIAALVANFKFANVATCHAHGLVATSTTRRGTVIKCHQNGRHY